MCKFDDKFDDNWEIIIYKECTAKHETGEITLNSIVKPL